VLQTGATRKNVAYSWTYCLKAIINSLYMFEKYSVTFAKFAMRIEKNKSKEY